MKKIMANILLLIILSTQILFIKDYYCFCIEEDNTLKEKIILCIEEEKDNDNILLFSKENNKKEKEEDIIIIEYKTGWISVDCVNIREKPYTKQNSNVLTTYDYNTEIQYTDYNDKWVKIKFDDDFAFVFKEYVSSEKLPEIDYIIYDIPNYSGFKSWMPYTSITSKSSAQYKLQYNYAYTGDYGIRMVNNRYCVAIGSHFNTEIGQKFDLILENGTIIPCVMGDLKANQHTDSSNIFSMNGCCSEFLIDKNAIISKIKNSGDTSSACEEWSSKVIQIKVYEDNIFD